MIILKVVFKKDLSDPEKPINPLPSTFPVTRTVQETYGEGKLHLFLFIITTF